MEPGLVFLSTLSLRRATFSTKLRVFQVDYFYPRSPCGERLWVLRKVPILGIFLSTLSLRRATVGASQGADSGHISIHALLAESDMFAGILPHDGGISIHALLAESDVAPVLAIGRAGYFYPRSPCGERQSRAVSRQTARKFLSTLSLRRATLVLLMMD